MWLEGFQLALSETNSLFLILGTLLGLIVGILPAIGPSIGVTLALPFTYGMEPATALIFLCAIQSACNYGDSIASILLNVPGGPGTVASCWDGYPLSQQGKAGTALGIATGASFVGGIIGWITFVFLARPMTDFALSIGAPEYFILGLMAMALISIASKGETIKGMIMGAVGLLLGMTGADPITAMTYRFSYGLISLEAGIELVLGALAIFALPQLIQMLEEGGTIAKVKTQIKDSVIGGIFQMLRRPLSIMRGGTIGWLIGVMPALGVSAAGITAYLIEKKYSHEKDLFGKGSMDGLTAAETAKGACILGDGICSLMLGVPGSVTWAILMAALIIHGVQPGPRFMTSGVLPYTIFAGLLLGQFAYFIIGILFVKYMTRVVYIPNQILAPIIAVLCFLGAFVAKNYLFDIWIMVALGIFAYVAKRNGYPVIPMILGFILAEIIETNFHLALGVGFGSYTVFFTRHISLTLLIITLLFIATPWIVAAIRKRRLVSGKSVEGLDAIADKEVNEIGVGELVFGSFVAILLLIFLVTAYRYPPDVRLFPVIVCYFGLILYAFWFLNVIRNMKILPFTFMEFALKKKEGLHWLLVVALMAVYALFVPVLGFVITSLIFFVVTAVLAGYKRWLPLAVNTVGIGIFLFLIIRFLKTDLPVGWLLK